MPSEERVEMSWVTLDRICQGEADGKDDVRRELGSGKKFKKCCGSRCSGEVRWE